MAFLGLFMGSAPSTLIHLAQALLFGWFAVGWLRRYRLRTLGKTEARLVITDKGIELHGVRDRRIPWAQVQAPHVEITSAEFRIAVRDGTTLGRLFSNSFQFSASMPRDVARSLREAVLHRCAPRRSD